MPQDTIVGEIVEDATTYGRVIWRIPKFLAVSKEKRHINSPSFTFEGNSWFLNLFTKSYANPKSMTLFLRTEKPQKYPISYFFVLVKRHGSFERLAGGVMGEDSSWSNLNYIMKISELVRRRAEFAPNGILSVKCNLRIHNFNGYSPKPEKLQKLQTLSQNLKQLFTEKINCDITLCVGTKDYEAHKAILIARSKVFAAMLQHDSLEKQTGRIIITDCDPNTFQIFLEFFYCGEVDVLTFENAYHLYRTSHKYQVEELMSFCIECLKCNITVENIFDLVDLANFYEEEKLMTAAQKFLVRNHEILQSSAWANFLNAQTSFEKPLLTNLLQVLKENVENVDKLKK